jgi:chaperone modulatory protein CbpM
MTQQHVALLLDEACLTVEDLALGCTVSREWIIEHVRTGVLPGAPDINPERWTFSGGDLLRARRLRGLERDFDANPELAGLVADLFDELERLRTRLRRAGLSSD